MLSDEQTTVESVLAHIGEFRMRWRSSIEERHIEAALLKHLREHYLHAENQYTLSTGVKIDIRVGRGMVNVELKTAKALLKTQERQRLYGQMIQYKRVGAKGLIVAVFGTAKDADNRAEWQEMRECLGDISVHFVFVEMPTAAV